MCAENRFCHRAGFEQAETEQDSVAYNAPNGVDGIPRNRYRLYQHRINCHADEDEKALKTQCKQAFQVVLPHVALLVVAPCCHGDGRKAHHAVNFNHTSVDDDEDHNAQYPHGDADEETLQKKSEQGANVHLHQAGLQHGQANVVDMGISGNDAAGIGHYLLGDVEHCHHDVESIERRWKELFEGELYKTKEAFESLKLTWSYIEDRKKIAGGEFDKEWFDLRVRCCLSECIKNIWLQAVEAGVLDDGIEKTGIPTSLEDAIAIIRRGCSLNCTNAIVELLDARIALQLEELDFEIREEGNKTNLYKMKDEYKIDFELLAEDANQNE